MILDADHHDQGRVVPVEFARGVHAASRFAWTYTLRLPD